MKASVNYVGNSSMIVGIRVESENIQTGTVNHCNFLFGFKDGSSKTQRFQDLFNNIKVVRFQNALKQIALKEKRPTSKHRFLWSIESIVSSNKYKVQIEEQ
jgi:acyl-CoA hydrolase